MTQQSALRTLVYLYLGTPSNDPFYPPTALNLLLNEAYLERAFDIRKSNPNYGFTVTTLTPTVAGGNTYALPVDFGQWLDVRINDANGMPLAEYSAEDVNQNIGADGFYLSGVEELAFLTTLSGVIAAAPIYLMYVPRPVPMAADTDSPVLIPGDYHTLLAMDVAMVCFAMGGEQAVPPAFLNIRQDKEARFWQAISQRGPQPTLTRTSQSNLWPG